MLKSKGILSCIGQTPLIKLEKLFVDAPFHLFAKLESFNPGGSIKDRPSLKMLQEALREGEIDLDTTIIESTSGNTGIGLAQACGYLRLKFICVTDARSTKASRKIVRAYGATVDVVEEPDPIEKTFLAGRLKRVQYLLKTVPNSFNCNQYTNPNHPLSHFQTIQEIFTALDDKVDYLFCTTSTCGTLRGCSDYISKHRFDTKVIAVDAEGSVIFGDTPKPRLVPGHGAGVVPPLYKSGLEDDHVLVSDLECVTGCRRLVKREAVFGGGSSGAVISAFTKFKDKIPAGSRCVVILSDRGDRYLDTIYSDKWVQKHFGDVSHLWEDPVISILENEK